MSERKLMKDGLNKGAISRLSSALACLFTDFPEIDFQLNAFRGLDDLELKERVRHVIRILHEYLPSDFESTALTLRELPNHWDFGEEGDALSGFAAWPIIDYIAEYGIDHPDTSLETLRALTSLFSAEFAIRRFLLEHADTCIYYLVQWVQDEDEHVRRLVSEGTRPRLPWGQQLTTYIKDPSEILNLLDMLKDDSSEYVRRSVANNLNDISKDHPARVIEFCQQLQQSPSPQRDWLIQHATRTLVKKGHSDVFDLLGYTKKPKITVSTMLMDAQQIMLGQTLSFTFDIQSESDRTQKLVVDYAIHFVKANGKRTPKVFKLRNVELGMGETQKIVKTHSFKEISTRKYYEGEHLIEILINGETHETKSFILYP